MAAEYYSFQIEQGATTEFEIIYADSSNIPIDLTGWSSQMQIRSERNKCGVLYATLSSSLLPDGTGLNMNGMGGLKPFTSGSIGLLISAATSSLFMFEQAFYDIELHSGSYVNRILQGKIKLSPQVTTLEQCQTP